MEGTKEEKQTVFEIAVVGPRRDFEERESDESDNDCIGVLVDEFKKAGLVVEKVIGVQHEFVKLCAPLETIGRAAAELQLMKRTQIGLDLPFEWDKAEAFAKQPDGSLFNWCERFRCYNHIIYGIVNKRKTSITLSLGQKTLQWESEEPLLRKLESENIVKEVFPLHDERKKKQLLRSWALNFWDITRQPIEEIHSYFGSKIATYFSFLGMYTKWMFFPAALGLTVQFVDFGALQLLVFPAFFITIVSWAALFFQFWKRKNAALLARWQISRSSGENPENEFPSSQSSAKLIKKLAHDKPKPKNQIQEKEWFGRIMRFRNDAIMIFSIICLQLPFELAFAHIYEAVGSNLIKYGLTAIYLLTIQYFNKIGGNISVNLTEKENNDSREYRSNSLIYKVFGLYFMQSYIGLFYHMFLHRNFLILRQVLVQRLIVSQVLQNLVENTWPYLAYSYKKYTTARKKRKNEKGSSTKKIKTIPRVEKEYLKPTYSASIGEELEDGLFDDFLEIAVQFGTIMMFACALPSSFALAILNNITEIRIDALKLVAVFRRPVPRASATIGAWLNIFQFLTVTSICTNCALLVCLYDRQGNWKMEPGLAAILIMEHVLLLIKYFFSRIVPEEPAWVKTDRANNIKEAQLMCSKELLHCISKEKHESESESGCPKA